eukprot:2163943-Amphidinium_carterae.1
MERSPAELSSVERQRELAAKVHAETAPELRVMGLNALPNDLFLALLPQGHPTIGDAEDEAAQRLSGAAAAANQEGARSRSIAIGNTTS